MHVCMCVSMCACMCPQWPDSCEPPGIELRTKLQLLSTLFCMYMCKSECGHITPCMEVRRQLSQVGSFLPLRNMGIKFRLSGLHNKVLIPAELSLWLSKEHVTVLPLPGMVAHRRQRLIHLLWCSHSNFFTGQMNLNSWNTLYSYGFIISCHILQGFVMASYPNQALPQCSPQKSGRLLTLLVPCNHLKGLRGSNELEATKSFGSASE